LERPVAEIPDPKDLACFKEMLMAKSGIPTLIDARHTKAYNKIMIIDNSTVIAGSFNFTKAAEERNAENLIIVKSRELVGICIDHWKKHRQHSEPYAARY
jgi:phosphatidylserine/phosphatidylglycerophosphate/cardiolipin synthase-like enzyme